MKKLNTRQKLAALLLGGLILIVLIGLVFLPSLLKQDYIVTYPSGCSERYIDGTLSEGDCISEKAIFNYYSRLQNNTNKFYLNNIEVPLNEK